MRLGALKLYAHPDGGVETEQIQNLFQVILEVRNKQKFRFEQKILIFAAH